MELLNGTTSLIIGNQVAKFAENIPADFDHVLMTDRHAKMSVNGLCCVCLKILIVGHQLDDSIPNFWADVIACRRDELQDCVDVPFVL